MRQITRRSRLIVPGTVALAIFMAAAPVAAVSWVKTTLANTSGAAIQDASCDGHHVAVAWQEAGPVTRVRTSVNDGSTFGSTHLVEPGRQTRQATTALCGSDLYVAFAQNYSQPSTPNLWLIYIDTDTLAGVNHAYSEAYQGQPVIGRYPSVACAGGLLWVTWEQKVGSQWHVFVNRAPRSFSSFDNPPTDLGLLGSNAGKPVISGSGTRVYVAWPTPGGTIRIHRWNVSGSVHDLGERQLSSGSTAGMPRIASVGSKVAVVWAACGDMRARVSNDNGTTWGSLKTIFHGVCGSEFGGLPNSVAINGGRILVAYYWFQGFNQKQRMISTTNNFGTFSDQLAYATSDLLLLGFVHPSGTTKIGGAVDEGAKIRFLRQP